MCLADHRRSGRRRARRQTDLAPSLLSQPVVHLAPDPAEGVTRQDDVRRFRAAMARLSDDDHELLTLIGWDGLAPRQAATVLGIGPATARVRLHRARQRLRALLDEELERPGPTGQMTGDGHLPVPAEERS